MMTRLGTFATACAGAVMFVATAQAADMPGSWPPPNFEPPKIAATELMSGWYLRGDIGYRYNHVSSVDASTSVTSQKYGNGFGASLGYGFKYQWFRADVTVDYGSQQTISGTTASASTQPQYTDRIDSITGLANFYVDFGTWGGFTPYAGAGAGVAYLRSRDYVNTGLAPGTPVDSAKKTNFAWAWMAGVSYQFSPSWVVDIGYRHLELGDAVSHAGPTGGPIADLTTWKKLSTDEIRIGARYLFD